MSRTKREEEGREGSAQERGGGVKGDRRESKGRERGAFKKPSEVERKEGRGRKEKGDGVSWWEFMVEEEGEGWKEVRKKKDKDRGSRKERRKRWFEEREERIRRERRLGEGE